MLLLSPTAILALDHSPQWDGVTNDYLYFNKSGSGENIDVSEKGLIQIKPYNKRGMRSDYSDYVVNGTSPVLNLPPLYDNNNELFYYLLPLQGSPSSCEFAKSACGILDTVNNKVTILPTSYGSYQMHRFFDFSDNLKKFDKNITNKLIVLIHGWNPSNDTDPYASPQDFLKLYAEIKNRLSGTDWSLAVYDWAKDAATGPQFWDSANNDQLLVARENGTQAAEIAHMHGKHLGALILEKNPSIAKIQFIAHSAGSWAARSAAIYLASKMPNLKIQITLLDPYIPGVAESIIPQPSYLSSLRIERMDELADKFYSLENYYSWDLFVWGTQATFDGWNVNKQVDFSSIKISKESPFFQDACSYIYLNGGYYDCYHGHGLPITWYGDTVKYMDMAPECSLTGICNKPPAGWATSMFSEEAANVSIVFQSPEPYSRVSGTVQIRVNTTGSSNVVFKNLTFGQQLGSATLLSMNNDGTETWGFDFNTASYGLSGDQPIWVQAVASNNHLYSKASEIQLIVNNDNRSISISAPVTGNSWQIGNVANIGWNSVGNAGGSVNIELSRNSDSGPWEPIGNNIANYSGSNSYNSWTVSGSASSNCKIRITSSQGVVATSGVFAIATYCSGHSIRVTNVFATNSSITKTGSTTISGTIQNLLNSSETVNVTYKVTGPGYNCSLSGGQQTLPSLNSSADVGFNWPGSCSPISSTGIYTAVIEAKSTFGCDFDASDDAGSTSITVSTNSQPTPRGAYQVKVYYLKNGDTTGVTVGGVKFALQSMSDCAANPKSYLLNLDSSWKDDNRTYYASGNNIIYWSHTYDCSFPGGIYMAIGTWNSTIDNEAFSQYYQTVTAGGTINYVSKSGRAYDPNKTMTVVGSNESYPTIYPRTPSPVGSFSSLSNGITVYPSNSSGDYRFAILDSSLSTGSYCYLALAKFTVTSPQCSLSIGKSGTGNGSVLVNSASYSLPYSGSFNCNSVVPIQAVPDSTSSFSGWSGPVTNASNIQTSVTVSSTNGTNVIANYSPLTGSVSVSISPMEAVTSSAKWRVDGGTWHNSGESQAGLFLGSHTLEFSVVNGWVTPTNQTISISATSLNPISSGTYMLQTGSLTVNLVPSGAVAANARWNVDGGSWQTSGSTVSGLSVLSSHLISYSSITGWTTPANQTVVVNSGQTTTTIGTYVELGTLSITTIPVNGDIYVDGIYKGIGTWSGYVVPGSHNVTFGSVSGYTSPSSQTVTVIAGQPVNVTGTYTEIGQIQYSLEVIKSGTGNGMVSVDSGTLTWSGNTGTAAYNSGTSVMLTATASAGSTFTGWSGACNGIGACNVTMDAAKSVTAAFTLTPCAPSSLQVTINSPAAGFTVNQGNSIIINAAVKDNCDNNSAGAAALAAFNNGDASITLYDDGAHYDGAAGDGVYGGAWAPNNTGNCTISIAATQAGLATGYGSVSGTVLSSSLSPGSISGTVTDNTNAALVGVPVYVCPQPGSSWQCVPTLTDGSGKYVISGLTPGVFTVTADGGSQFFAEKFYNNTYDYMLAAPVTVLSGSETPNINFSLEPGGKISGTVRDSGTSSPLAGILIAACNIVSSSQCGFAMTDNQGKYAVNIPTGNYIITAMDGMNAYAQEFYNGVTDPASATPVSAIVGVNKGGINFYLDLVQPGAISGTVTNSAGAPIPNIQIAVQDANWNWYGGAQTNGSGNYTISGLPTRTDYKVRANGSSPYATQYKNNIAVNAPNTTTVNFTLPLGGSIAGKVVDSTTGTGIGGIWINVNDVSKGWNSWDWVGSATTNADGTYSIQGTIPEGSYIVQARDDQNHIYVRQVYNGTIDEDMYTPVTVTSGVTTSNINFSLIKGGKVSGQVKDALGNPLQNMRVSARTTDNAYINDAVTDANGNYTITAVLPGNIVAACETKGSQFIPVYYPGVIYLEDAKRVAVVVDQVTPNIDFKLTQGAVLKGAVTVDNAPANYGWVNLYSVTDGRWMMASASGGTDTDGIGQWTAVVPPGTYKLWAGADPKGAYAPIYYNGTYLFDNAMAVTAAGTETISDLNFSLTSSNKGTINGTISYSGASAGEKIVWISPNPGNDWPNMTSGDHVLQSAYTLPAPTGTWHVKAFLDVNGNLRYDSGEPFGEYTGGAVTVATGSSLNGIDIVINDVLITHIITTSAGAGGSITPSGSITVNHGTDKIFTITSDTGYHISDVLVDGASVGAMTTYTFTNVTANHTIIASFAINTYILTVNKTGTGSGTVSGAGTYNFGTPVTLTASPDVSSTFAGWTGGGCSGTGTCAVTMDADKTVTATFTQKVYAITATAGANGSVICTPATVNYGSSSVCTIAPATGYAIADVVIDGLSQNPDPSTYTFSNVTDNHTISATFTVLSAGQSTIVFTSTRDGNSQIYKMNADGTNQTRITNDTYNNIRACASPDGSKIAFSTDRSSSYCDGKFCDLYVINMDGTGLKQLTNVAARNVYNVGPCLWSQDGAKVYFGGRSVSSGGYHELWGVNADGYSQQKLLAQSGRDFSPTSLSADGLKLSIHDGQGYADGSDNVQSIVNVDGTGYVKSALAAGPRDDFGSWSPDGTKFAYMKGRGSGSPTQIYMENGTGNDYPGVNITTDSNENWWPHWSPDGSKIVYAPTQGGYSHIWVMNVDGTGKTPLTTGNYSDSGPVWTVTSVSYTLFHDHFDDGIYTDKWTATSQTGNSTITESESELHIHVPYPPGDTCSGTVLDSNSRFSGQNLTVEVKVKPVAKGFVALFLKKDDNNYVYFGFNTDDVPNVEFRSTEGGVVQQQNIENSSPYFGKYNTFKIVKTGNQYEVYLNDTKKGVAYTNVSMGDSNLVVELQNHTCSWKSGDADNYYDYVSVSGETITDVTPPITAAAPASGVYNSDQSITLTCNDGTGSGCDKIYYTTDGSAPTTSSPVYSTAINISTSAFLKFFAVDKAGNQESVKTEAYVIDKSPPTGSITINSGAATTNTVSVTLTLLCTDSESGCSQMQFSNDNTNWSASEAYATTKVWNLTTGDGTKTVYAKFKDGIGNWSNGYSNTILLNTGAKPDFVVSALTASSIGGAGKSLTVTDTTKNEGPGDAGATTTSIYFSAKSSIDSTAVLLDSRTVPALVAGAKDIGSMTVTIPAGTAPGNYYLIARADSGNAVKELYEYNNTAIWFIQIGL